MNKLEHRHLQTAKLCCLSPVAIPILRPQPPSLRAMSPAGAGRRDPGHSVFRSDRRRTARAGAKLTRLGSRRIDRWRFDLVQELRSDVSVPFVYPDVRQRDLFL